MGKLVVSQVIYNFSTNIYNQIVLVQGRNPWIQTDQSTLTIEILYSSWAKKKWTNNASIECIKNNEYEDKCR